MGGFKKFFLNQNENDVSPPLSIGELIKLRDHYKKKFNINIVINGEKHEKKQKENERALRQFKKYPYAEFIRANWSYDKDSFLNKFCISLYRLPFDNCCEAIREKLKKYGYLNQEFSKKDQFIENLNSKQISKLNIILHTLPKEVRALIDQQIPKYLAYLEHSVTMPQLTKDEVEEEEVQMIQQDLLARNSEEKIGYLFTGGNNDIEDRGHFEILIITKNKIIRPIAWPPYGLWGFLAGDDYYVPKPFFDGISDICQPQASAKECGTLCLVYLKELLKENGKQFVEYTLCFSSRGEKIFFPSPQVLRYSQISFYNQYMLAMLEEGDGVSVTYNDKTYQIETLEKLLKNKVQANPHNKEYQDMLNNLPAFRAKWLAQWEQSNKKRNFMQQNGRNHYLFARASLLMQKSQAASEHATLSM